MLLLFPNTFEFFFIFYEAVRLRFQPSRFPPRFWYAIAAGLWVFVKLPQEYWIHIAQRDFTDTVAENPWVGAVSALFVLALAAVGLFVVRPRLPAPDWRWRIAADPLPASLTDAHARHAHRLGKGGILWAELAEKVALLALLSVIFAAILPHVTASSLEVALGVAVIVCANTAISMAYARSERLSIESSAISFAALLAVNLGFVYVVSRVFSSADTVRLATALFFAFLITLLIWLYDVYKPTYDVRFTVTPVA
jgi:hypothetical protein